MVALNIKAIIALLMLFAILLSLAIFTVYMSAGTLHPYKSFYLNGKGFNISYIAATQSQLLHGLMNTTITNSTIMLFEFPTPGVHPFWMYDTYANLDMIWVNYSTNSGTIVYIAQNATSCFILAKCLNQTYYPNVSSNYVIEAKSGFVVRNNISVGDKIILN